MHRLLRCLLTALSCGVFADTATAAPLVAGTPPDTPTLAWHVEYGGPGNDSAFAVAVSGPLAFTAGGYSTSTDPTDYTCFGSPYYVVAIHCNLSVTANGLSDGRQAWQYQTPGRAESVTTAAGKVFVAGAGAGGSGTDFRVVALDQKTGKIIWSNGDLVAGTIGAEAFSVGVQGNIVVAVGVVFTNPDFGGSVHFIRAYDINTGAVLWQDMSSTNPYQGFYFSVALTDTMAVAAGGSAQNYVIRAFDIATGAILWEQETSTPGFDGGKAVQIRDNRIVAVGEIASGLIYDSRDYYAQSYDLSGNVLWTSQIDSGGFDFYDAMSIGSKRTYAGGTGGPKCLFLGTYSGDCLWTVRALDSSTGATAWSDVPDSVAGISQVTSLGLSGRYLYATGNVGPRCTNICQVVLKAYEANSGRVIYSQILDFHGGDNTSPALSAADGYLVLVGSTQTAPGGDYNGFISTYRIATPGASGGD